jgi:hypothetical protein
MPLKKLQLKPGIDRETTTYMNEGGFYACDKIRFRSGSAEKLGGWSNQAAQYTFNGVARNMWNWVTYDSQNLLGVGTSQKYYIQNSPGSSYHDITPIRTTVTLGANPFAVTSGSLLVVVTAATHGATAGSFVTYSGATNVGGLTLNGEYEIVTIVDVNTYYIISATAATSTATGGGAVVSAAYQLDAGSASYTIGTGWGAGGWGGSSSIPGSGWGGYGTTTSTQQLRLWSSDNYQQDLVFSPRGGAIYYWAYVTPSTFNRATTLGSVANLLSKTYTYGISAGVGNTITVDSSDFIDVGSVVTGTNVPASTTVTSVSGQVVTLSAATTGAASGTYYFSYAGMFVPNITNFIIASDAQHFTICLGANPYDPTSANTTFDPMLVRWSDQDNPWDFVPTSFNQSGEQKLANGSYLVCSKSTRQETLIWSDAALYTMQYVGPPYVWSFSLLMDNISIAGPNATVVVNNIAFWMGMDKFFMYNGTVNTLPCSLRRHVFNNINKDQLTQVTCGSNEGFNEVWWHYPSADSIVNNRYVIYNYVENLWYYGTLNRTAWLDSPLRLYPMAAFSVQTSYLSVALTSSATSLTLLDGSSYPSSGVVIINSEQIAYTGVTNDTLTGLTRGYNGTTAASHVQYSAIAYYVPNQILFHEFGIDDVTASTGTQGINAYIETSDFDIDDGDHFAFVWRIVPDLTFDGSNSAVNPVAYLTLKPRDASGSTYTVAPSLSVTGTTDSGPNTPYTPQVYTRVRGRQMAFRMESSAIGTNWQMGNMRIDIRQDGRR